MERWLVARWLDEKRPQVELVQPEFLSCCLPCLCCVSGWVSEKPRHVFFVDISNLSPKIDSVSIFPTLMFPLPAPFILHNTAAIFTSLSLSRSFAPLVTGPKKADCSLLSLPPHLFLKSTFVLANSPGCFHFVKGLILHNSHSCIT